MGWIIDGIGWAFIGAGSFFCIVGAFGMLRMPDFYTRMHASSVIDPFGVVLILTGLVFKAGFTLTAAKLGIIILLLLFTGPVASHALGRAALHRGLKPKLSDNDACPPKP